MEGDVKLCSEQNQYRGFCDDLAIVKFNKEIFGVVLVVMVLSADKNNPFDLYYLLNETSICCVSPFFSFSCD